MANPAIDLSIHLAAPPATVFEALTQQTDLSSWLSPDCQCQPIEGTLARLGFGDGDYCEVKIHRLDPGRRVVWTVADSRVQGTREWNGTAITFDLEPDGAGTRLRLRHDGWKDKTACFAYSQDQWRQALEQRLQTRLAHAA